MHFYSMCRTQEPITYISHTVQKKKKKSPKSLETLYFHLKSNTKDIHIAKFLRAI